MSTERDWADYEAETLLEELSEPLTMENRLRIGAETLRRARAAGLREGAEIADGMACFIPVEPIDARYRAACIEIRDALERLANAAGGGEG